ncbi:MAG: cation:proton antiporter [Chitinispirillaceae bacterium]|nr:cation:proton antiporter [Chitinispirillaceae bacterium]
MELNFFLRDIVVIFGAALLVSTACRLLKIPAIVGLLLTGCLVGPFGAGLIHQPMHVETIAELGVVFLLFEIGLELSIKRLKRIGRIFFGGGLMQAAGTIIIAMGTEMLFGLPLLQALFFGMVLSLSSTAIVLRLYNDNREMETPHGGIALGILLFQDLLIVPFLLIVPLLGGSHESITLQFFLRFLAACAIISLTFTVSRYVVPRVLHFLANTRARELLVIGSLFLCLGTALVTQRLGFSLALGAFLAGVLISESDYRHQVLAETMPFRDVFTSMFFISIGMLLRLDFVLANPAVILLAVVLIFTLKGTALFATVRFLSFPAQVAVTVAMGLSQIGEFAFVLLQQGKVYGVVDAWAYQLGISSSIVTMLLTPLFIWAAPHLARRTGNAVAEPLLETGRGIPSGHVIIVGFGLAGRHLARVLNVSGVPYVILELNGSTVKEAKKQGEPILYGDASRPAILQQCAIGTARFVVFVISDTGAMQRGARLARQMNPSVFIIARARMQADIEELRRNGADEVVSAEFETSIEIFTNLLTRLGVPGNIIRSQTRLLRHDDYTMLRSVSTGTGLSKELHRVLSMGTTETFLVTSSMYAAGKSIMVIDLRKRTGATIIALVRSDKPFTNPGPETVVADGDVLVLVGSHVQIDAAFAYLEHGPVSVSPT